MTIQRAAVLYDQRRYDLAAEAARQTLAQDPEDAEAHALLSLALTQLKRFDEATREAQSAIAADPELPVAHAAHAIVLGERYQFTKARRAAEEAIRLDPADPDLYALLAKIDVMRSKWSSVYETTSRGLAVRPDHTELLRLRSIAAEYLGRPDEAMRDSLAALSTSPDEPQALATHGYQLMLVGRFREARSTFDNALRLDPMNRLARLGLVEMIKATNPIYRSILRFFVWAERLSGLQKWLILLAPAFVYNVLWRTGALGSAQGWLLPAAAAAWLALILSTWLAYPLSNLALMLHPVGRHALNKNQRVGAMVVGSLLGASVLGLMAYAAGVGGGLYLAATFGAAAIPAAALYKADGVGTILVLLVLTSLAVATGVAAVALAIVRGDGLAGSSPAWTFLWASLALSIVGMWLGQLLVRVQPIR